MEVKSCPKKRTSTFSPRVSITRHEDLVRELGSCDRVPFSLATSHFGKRTNRHIIGSQNDLIYLLGGHLESAVPPAKEELLRKIENSLNQTPMSYLGMECPRAALFRYYEKNRKCALGPEQRRES